ncbi:Fanconi anemia group A protein isoform X2 [Oncorhynchus nerka]|uniref:Fanconi anemia group A protein isoform X2 n=1 Tax=Oncorhynchus nerka TaxID=8023 RepID=UPI0011320A6D|nr:Fanconi anemia group A protein isoform X2 [Oncorhynchus nerka]
MSLGASSMCPTQKRTLSCLLGRVGKRPKQENVQELQEAAVQLLNRHQNLSDLFLEVGSPNPCNLISKEYSGQKKAASESPSPTIGGSLLGEFSGYVLHQVNELRRKAGELGVPVAALSVKMVVERLLELTDHIKGDREQVLLNSTQRVQLSVLFQSTRELLSLEAFCSKLFWQEYWRAQKRPMLEVVYHLHTQNILSLEYMLESENGVRSWLMSELKALCGRTATEKGDGVPQQVLSTVVSVLVQAVFEETQDSTAAPCRRLSQVCCSVLDDMLSWVLDTLNCKPTLQSGETTAELWVQMFDASLCGVSVSPDALRHFFTHSLTHTLTYRPRLKVSDAIAMQREWSFAKTCRLLTSLFRKLAVIFKVEELLSHLQQVLETHEVNWQHVLSCLSTLLVYNPNTQPSLKELLSRLLSSAFEGYDLENMITAFLLARQGALEGPGVFPSYSEWFKMSFGGASSYHGNSKKSLVFLLKFLSDLVPFDPPQYLKVHILHPPYVAVKHRALLQEYVSLTKTRLADLKVSIEEMGLYEDISGAGTSVQPRCQARQDVEKAISLFGSTGRISATVMEASIFRRPYFLSRFLPALLTPRVLPVKPDARMNFIDSLKKAEKIPAAQHSSYIESCQRERQRQQDSKGVSVVNDDDHPQEVLQVQLQEHRALLTEGGSDGEVSAQLARISHTLSIVFPERAEELVSQAVIQLHVDESTFSELHNKVVNMILRSFCQSLLDASRISPPNKQSPWASQFVNILLGHRQLLTALLHRMWDLLHNQGVSLSAAHVLGLAAFVVHLHASQTKCPKVQLCPPLLPGPVSVPEALTTALPCTTQTNMLFCVRFCLAAVCYGLCRSESLCDQPQQYNPCSLYKKLLYLIPRLMPDMRRLPIEASGESEYVGANKQGEEENRGLWKSVTDTNTTWRKSAWALWKHAPFRLLVKLPEYQFSFSEWLAAELRVQRSEDALSDPDRQEYQQWACQQLYLPSPVDKGGCAGDLRTACSHILNAVMDQKTVCAPTQENTDHRPSEAGTCLPDIFSRLQEIVYEMELTSRSQRTQDKGHFLLDLISHRCSVTSDLQSISSELSIQQTLHTWNRVILALPAVMLVTVKTGGGKRTLDCETLMEHINQYQRKGCSPAGLLPYHLTAHFLRAVLMASVSCDCASGEVNKAMSLISLQCPLLLVSAGHWWGRLSPVLVSLWHRLTDGQPLPQQLQVLGDCHLWVCSSKDGVSCPVPSAPPLLLAACLHCVWEGQASGKGIRTSLEMLGQLTEQHSQLLVFLLFLCVTDLLTTFLTPQRVKGLQRAQELCKDILTVLVDSADWLLLFKTPCSEKGLYQPVAVVTSDEYTRLMPLAFYSLVPHLNSEILEKTVKAPGFLHTAVLCYSSLIKLFMDGQTPCPVTEHLTDQMDPSYILTRAQQVLLKTISLTSPTSLSQHQLNQLEALCVDLDPEVAAALVFHLSSSSLSPELDFL